MQFDVGLTVNKQGKPALDCQFAVPRLLNTSASLSVDASISSMIAHALNLKYALPLNSAWTFHAEAVKQMNDHSFASSFTEAVSGVRLSYSYLNKHVVGVDAHLRDVYPVIGGSRLLASEQIRRVPLRTIKTGVNYRFLIDKTVKTPHPVGGFKFSFLSDLCGLFGDLSILKLETVFWNHRRLTDHVTWHSRLGAGAIAHLRSGKVTTPIQDRFFLGGTNEELSQFKGFAMRAVGPAGKRVTTSTKKGDKLYDHLGGDVYVSIDNSVSFPVYTKDDLNIRGIVFAQVGSLIPSLHARAPQELVRSARASLGVGVVVPIGSVGTLELTVGKPVLGMVLSDYQQMLQIGIRISNSQTQ